MTLKDSLKDRPIIYEIVPPRKDTSRFITELRGVEDILHDSRIMAINIPELINRIEREGRVTYSPATIPPEEYAQMIRHYKEGIVNIISPRLEKEAFLRRAHKVLQEYHVPNLVVVGKERHGDLLPGPGVLEALELLNAEKHSQVALGGICIFNRSSSISEGYGQERFRLSEHRRVWLKEGAGCDFVTSQIMFDPGPALGFLSAYQRLCEETGRDPLTVFLSITTVPTQSILALLESLDVVIPLPVRKKLLGGSDMGKESLKIATEVFLGIVEQTELSGIKVPMGLQIEQVGVNSDQLSLALLDRVYGIIKK